MNRNDWNGLKRFVTVAMDVVLFNASILLAFVWKFGHMIPERNFVTYEQSAVVISLLFLLVNFLLGAYIYYNRRVSDILFITVLGQILTILGITIISFIGRYFAFPRSVLIYSFITSVVILGVWRVLIFYLYLHFTNDRRVAVVAHSEELPAVVQNFDSSKNNKHKITHVITAHFVDNVKQILEDVDIVYITKGISDADRRQIVDLAIKKEKEIFVPLIIY